MTCQACKKRDATCFSGGIGRKDRWLCTQCFLAAWTAEMDQALEAFRHFKDAPTEPWDGDCTAEDPP